jgi:peptide/nickel transport system substrate-binding protein
VWNLIGRAGIVLEQGETVDYQTDANGTGPFALDQWRQGDSIAFVRNEAYWGEPAQLAEVVFDHIPDNQAAFNAALAGEVDVVTGFDANLREQIEATGDSVFELGQSTDKGTLAFNQTSGPLADVRVGQAIDHDAIVQALASGQTRYGPIPELDPGYEDLAHVAPYDPEAARALLAEAGAEDLELTLTIPSFYSTTIPQILVSDLNEVGITLEVESVDFSTWLNDVFINQDST